MADGTFSTGDHVVVWIEEDGKLDLKVIAVDPAVPTQAWVSVDPDGVSSYTNVTHDLDAAQEVIKTAAEEKLIPPDFAAQAEKAKAEAEARAWVERKAQITEEAWGIDLKLIDAVKEGKIGAIPEIETEAPAAPEG